MIQAFNSISVARILTLLWAVPVDTSPNGIWLHPALSEPLLASPAASCSVVAGPLKDFMGTQTSETGPKPPEPSVMLALVAEPKTEFIGL